MRPGDVIEVHPSMVPPPGQQWVFRLPDGKRWVGEAYSGDHIMVLFRWETDGAGDPTDPRLDANVA